jgi:hypothetical protein
LQVVVLAVATEALEQTQALEVMVAVETAVLKEDLQVPLERQIRVVAVAPILVLTLVVAPVLL